MIMYNNLKEQQRYKKEKIMVSECNYLQFRTEVYYS